MAARTAPLVVLLGAGDRGRIYADLIRRDGRLRLTAVADPVESKRDYIQTSHGLPRSSCFTDWVEALRANPSADAVIVATQDRMHVEPARQALANGAHVLLEKPMAPNREEVREISKAARDSKGTLTVCHVLRYSGFFRKVKEVVASGRLGSIQSIFHAENVSYYHFAHSYVRGNWRNAAASSPLILAKSCHDLDLLC